MRNTQHEQSSPPGPRSGPDAPGPWRTAITCCDDDSVWYQGLDVTNLMQTSTFAETVFLLHKGRLPVPGERRLIDAMLIAVADHGPGAPSAVAMRTVATGNRVAPEAAIAAGILAIGDAHGGAGLACLRLITDAIAAGKADNLSLEQAADRVASEAKSAKRRLPGFGHRTHRTDPRTVTLLQLARATALDGDGVAFATALERSVAARIKPLPMNVDGAMAAVLYDLGFPPLLGKLMFIIGRTAGLSAQLVEEYTRERAMRITVPVVYDGPAPQKAEEVV
jgi:citrate synthase